MRMGSKLGWLSLAGWMIMAFAGGEEAGPVPLTRAHSHNDYMRQRPLVDALDCGFCSIEADIHLVDGALLVAHDLKMCKPERTLQALYLEPLRERVRAHGGRVFPGGPVVTLLIDFKSDADTTYPVLHEVLKGYADMLTEYKDGVTTERAVTVILSGNTPMAAMQAQSQRFAAADGRPGDLDANPPANLVPWISSDWNSLFTWRGRGEMPAADRVKLDDMVKRTHEQGRRLRFWGLPMTPEVWPLLYSAGVDLLNADSVKALRDFLLKQPAAQR